MSSTEIGGLVCAIVLPLIGIFVLVHTYLHSFRRYERMQMSFPSDDFDNYFTFFDGIKSELDYWKIWKRFS